MGVHGATQPPMRRGPAPLAAAAGAMAAAAADSLIGPSALFGHTTVLMVPVYAVMAFAPSSKAARWVASSPALPLAFCVLYALQLVHAATVGGLFQVLQPIVSSVMSSPILAPDLTAIAAVFSSPALTALTWVHLLTLDFFQARTVFIDGLQWGVPTSHSVFLCFMFGPLGLMSHFITRKVASVLAMQKQPAVASL
ncbi:hypothetical protein FOA52_004718 [Chlamydomonas sp. UWO 241]|nr:hypothetical protein FOA52_004718 [Chlamydomonas sp. UWO 241]